MLRMSNSVVSVHVIGTLIVPPLSEPEETWNPTQLPIPINEKFLFAFINAICYPFLEIPNHVDKMIMFWMKYRMVWICHPIFLEK